MNRRIQRGNLRLFLGKIYFQWKRYLVWFLERKTFAVTKVPLQEVTLTFPISIFKHSSPIYRKLKDVPMYLQENKKINLEIAISKLDGIVLYPNQVFRFGILWANPRNEKGICLECNCAMAGLWNALAVGFAKWQTSFIG